MKIEQVKQPKSISVVIPTYNGAVWLPKTIAKVVKAVEEAGIKAYEVLIVNDGSTDNTIEVIEQLKTDTDLPINFVTQKNSGRFVARKTGTENAKYELLLFVDTRVFIGKEALKYVLKQQQKGPSRQVWCSHVRVEKVGNIYARFWEAVAFLAWRNYFKNPRDISYGIQGFDDYPKGTTCFIATRTILKEANEWFVDNTKDLKTSNDDTLLIRHIAESNSINISPDYWCLYHARTSLRQFTKHVHHRGKVFVDGFLRRDGNKFFWFIVLFLIATVSIPVFWTIYPSLIFPSVLAGCIFWVLGLLISILSGVEFKDALSLFILAPVFVAFYGAGIWSAFLKIFVLPLISRKKTGNGAA